MKIKYITKNLIDVFLDKQTFPTGFEASCWLRLQNRHNKWTQISGIKVQSWEFKKIIDSITTLSKKETT